MYRLALESCGPRNLVRRSVALGLPLLVVNADQDAGVVGRVGAGEGDGLATGARS